MHVFLGANFVARSVIGVMERGVDGIALMETMLGVIIFSEYAQ